MASLALDVLDFVLLGRLRIVEISSGRAGLDAVQVLEMLITSMRKDTGADMMVVDSLTTFVSHGVTDEAVAYFEDCREICSDYGKTIMNISNSYAFDNTTLARLRSMCDAHLSLRVEEVGDKLVKILEVSKIRGASKTTGNIITFDVEPNLGMRIIPISKASA